MNLDPDAAYKVRDMFERAVDTLATGTGHIQQRLADAYVISHLGDDVRMNPDLPSDVYALRLDLQSAMGTAHDFERAAAAAPLHFRPIGGWTGTQDGWTTLHGLGFSAATPPGEGIAVGRWCASLYVRARWVLKAQPCGGRPCCPLLSVWGRVGAPFGFSE